MKDDLTLAAHPEDIDLSEVIRDALFANDLARLIALIAPLSPSAALRELLNLPVAKRTHLLSILPAEMGADLIHEAPNETAVAFLHALDTDRAVKIIDELDSDIQADLIGELDNDQAEAVLAGMDAEDAADWRRVAAQPSYRKAQRQADRHHGRATDRDGPHALA